MTTPNRDAEMQVRIPVGSAVLEGVLALPRNPAGIVVFAHGSGSSRYSPRNRFVADRLQEQGLGTLLIDLLTSEEGVVDTRTARLRFDIELLADRLVRATDWLSTVPTADGLKIGYFGASTGAAAALRAAAERPEAVRAVVSRGGRPDLADQALPNVHAAVLLIVGENDLPVIRLNKLALTRLDCEKRFEIVPGASHLFEEPGTLDQVARWAAPWFRDHLGPIGAAAGSDLPAQDSENHVAP